MVSPRKTIAHLAIAATAILTVSVSYAQSRISEPEIYSSVFVVGNIVDYKNKNITAQNKVVALVILGKLVGNAKGYADMSAAKAAAAKIKGAEVIIKNGVKGGKLFSLHAVAVAKTTPDVLAKFEAKDVSSIKHDPAVPFDFTSLVLDPDVELVLPYEPIQPPNITVVEIVSDAGLFIGSNKLQDTGNRGSKYFRMTMDIELGRGNFEEAKAVYVALDERNKASNDLEVVKITRSTNLKKMFHSGPYLRPFVESEMKRWNYTEVQMDNVRGTIAPK